VSPEAIHRFQKTPRLIDGELRLPFNWFGKPLKQDGDLGPQTRWAIALSHLDPRRQAVTWRACSSVGKAETVANRGEWPDFCHRWCGFEPPEDPDEPMPNQAWCAEQASWCFSVDGLPERREAGAQALGRSLRRTTLVLPGDGCWYPTGSWQGHFDVIVGTGPGELAVVGGNRRNASRLVRVRSSDVNIVTPFPVEEWPGIPPGLELVAVQAAGTR
jgi:hypothetical protein